MSTGHGSPNAAKARIANSMGKASILMEALPYIQRFRKHIVVVKYGGSTMEDPELRASFAGDITLLSTVGIHPVIVHGGGPQITDALVREGVEIHPMSELGTFAPEHQIEIAIITTPAEAAQAAADAIVAAGIRGVLNFAPVQLQVPQDVKVKKVDLTTEFDNLVYHLYARTR